LVIDDTGNNLGVLKTPEALKLAQEKGLDLIEVSPQAKPPVARIMSFDKYRYEQTKKLKKQKAKQRGQEMKYIKISIREAKGDLERKAKKIDEFLDDGNQVEILIWLRGREKANKDFAKTKLTEFLTVLNPDHRVIMAPKYSGRGFVVQVTKKS
jgi:translation initiation factor IF-3